MQDTELFLSLAEIAGVFVGFGALIAIRGGGASAAHDVGAVSMVVWTAILVVVVALTPVTLSRFGITGHTLWLACSLAALALFWIGDEAVRRLSPVRRALLAAWPLKTRWRVEIVGAVFVLPMTLAQVAVVLGLLPEQEPALYLASVVLLLLMDAWLLLMLVFSVGFPQAGREPNVEEGSGAPGTP